MDHAVSSAEAEGRLPELLSRARSGEEVVITDPGETSVRLTSMQAPSPERRREAIEAIRRIRQQIAAKGGGATVDEIIAWKNEGRR